MPNTGNVKRKVEMRVFCGTAGMCCCFMCTIFTARTFNLVHLTGLCRGIIYYIIYSYFFSI